MKKYQRIKLQHIKQKYGSYKNYLEHKGFIREVSKITAILQDKLGNTYETTLMEANKPNVNSRVYTKECLDKMMQDITNKMLPNLVVDTTENTATMKDVKVAFSLRQESELDQKCSYEPDLTVLKRKENK